MGGRCSMLVQRHQLGTFPGQAYSMHACPCACPGMQVYNQCSQVAREMAKISASDLLHNTGGVGSVLRSFLPSFTFKLPFIGRWFGRSGGGGTPPPGPPPAR